MGHWEHRVATVERLRPDSSWYSQQRVLHRGDVIRAEVAAPGGLDGAPLFDAEMRLVGLSAMVRSNKGELIGVSADTIRAFLGPPG